MFFAVPAVAAELQIITTGAVQGVERPMAAEFRAAILAADSLVHMDPAAGISSGIAISRIFTELGIADQVAEKALLQSSGYSAEQVASGRAVLAIQNMTQLMAVEGVTIVGPLPPEIQTQTNYVAGVAAQSAHKELRPLLLPI